MELLSQRPRFSTDPDTKGFDLSAGNKWIYPENFPLRDYQYAIVNSALYHNTLVCLPTGLGKTFIAAVVMYNYWRWYPQGKIVFLAPTKPLVAQQINACQEIMGIPSDESVELTGATEQKKRQIAWMSKRVIFATPQVFQKDLEKNILPADLVKCIIIDEAHRALGKHSYCESIRLMSETSEYFRVLGLSATPGGKLDAVQEVVRNLHITHLELRDDTSPDIIPYINERKLDIILVGLGVDLEQFKERYVRIMDRHVRVLIDNHVIRGNTGNISKGRIFLINRDWHQRPNKGPNHGLITKTLMILLTMYHAYELMIRHGLRAFYNFYHKHDDKFWLKDEQSLIQLLEEISYYLGPFPDMNPLPDGSLPDIPQDIRFGHHKFQKLREILLRHFENYEDKEETTRAIVFVEFRDSVNEVYVLLLQSLPLIRPQKFVGQAGQKQKQQKQALEDFRSNKVNVLISTSVGEEGLDVGEVDLIVCFDTSQNSPTRLVQRMGRTGRKRNGHIIVLVTDGKEHMTLRSAMSRRDSLNNKVLQSSGIINALYEKSPRMVPDNLNPECMMMHITSMSKGPQSSKAGGKKREVKKPRKRRDPNNKGKLSKNPEPSTSGCQSSLMKFLKKAQDDPPMEIDDDIVRIDINEIRPSSTTQNSQSSLTKNANIIKSGNVKLLTSDDAGVEFLTLCTMKKTDNENKKVDKARTNRYYPSYHEKRENIDGIRDLEIPSIQLLDRLKELTYWIEPNPKNNEHEDNDASICNQNDRFWTTPRFDDHQEFSNDHFQGHSKFEDILDDSSSDNPDAIFHSTVAINDDLPDTEKVDWGENNEVSGFEDLLNEDWSNDSMMSIDKNRSDENGTSNKNPNALKPNAKSNSVVLEDLPSTSRTIEPNPKFHETTRNSSAEFGAFEELLNEDSTTSVEKNESGATNDETKNNSPKKTDVFQNLKTELDETTINSSTKFGAFEDLLNDDSTTSLEKNSSDTIDRQKTTKSTKNFVVGENSLKPDSKSSERKIGLDETTRNSSTGFVTFEELLNAEDSRSRLNENVSRTSENEITKNSQTHFGLFEDLLNEDSSTSLENNLSHRDSDSDATIDGLMSELPENTEIRENPKTNLQTNEKNENSVRRENIESETKNKFGLFEEILNSSSNDETQIDPEFIPKIQSPEIKIARTNINDKFDNFEAEMKIEEIAFDEEFDIFDNRDVKIEKESLDVVRPKNKSNDCPLNEESRKLDKTQNQRFASVSKIREISETPKNPVQAVPTMSTKKNDEKFVDINAQAHSRSSRFETTNVNKSQIDKTPESEDDIFDIDDLMVDSDFEEKINEIENSVKNVNTSENRRSIVESINDKNDQCETRSTFERSSKIFDPQSNSIKKKLDNLKNDVTSETKSTPSKSFRIEVNLNNWVRKKSAGRVSIEQSFVEKNENSKDSRSSPGKTLRFEVNRPNSNENNEVFQIRETNPKNSCGKKQNDETIKETTPLKISVADYIVDDCDWSSDYENHFDKSSNSKEKEKIVKVEDTTGWLSSKTSTKPRPSISKKLSRNVCNNSSSKLTLKGTDSDSENEFCVSRVETTISRAIESDYFAKPAIPVTLKKSTINSPMSNSRRFMRGPLSLRRNDDNKIDVKDLNKFSAPAKYAEHEKTRETSNDRSLGSGRKKSVSLDLDTRKRKRRKRRGESAKRSRARNEFIDDEAEITSGDDHTTETSESDEDDLGNFVSYTQNVDEPVDMRAHYLQSVKSPRRPGAFFIRKAKSPNMSLEIYSQAIPEADAYIYDSFCVDENEEISKVSTTSDELTDLDDIVVKRNRKKRKRNDSKESRAARKRKVFVQSSDATSSEDEIEKLRRQVRDESFELKNRRD